ncbi:MAG: response regulator transcription factor [Breznakibacter sp.]
MQAEKTKILLVEDDTSLGFLLVDFLESNNFDVKLYRDGVSGLNAFQQGGYQFCILDVMLPGDDGFSIAEKIREGDKNVPIIFLTARTLKDDKIKGFHLGVDDYITKPFDEDELLCRIHAILNRVQRSAFDVSADEKYFVGTFTFDCRNHLLINGPEERRLTQKESEVLKVLCRWKNQVVKRDELLIAVWGNNDYFNGRSMDVFITKLRKYLQPDPRVAIENIPKIGFMLRDSL